MARILFALLLTTAAAAAQASAGATSVNAPGDILLFGLGVSGVLIGRRLHRRRRDRRRDG